MQGMIDKGVETVIALILWAFCFTLKGTSAQFESMLHTYREMDRCEIHHSRELKDLCCGTHAGNTWKGHF